MDVRFASPELCSLDGLKCEAVAITVFDDERPPPGALGLLDWRLCGLVSRMMLRGRVKGTRGEVVLIPARPRLPMDKLLLFGLGDGNRLEQASLQEANEQILETLVGAGVRSSALVLPGRSLARVEPSVAMESFLRTFASRREFFDELIVLEPHDAQKAMQPVVDGEKRRARAALE